MARPLSLVCASAGFGKTTLVSSWIAQLESTSDPADAVPAAWLLLDQTDSDPLIFVRNVIAALRTIFADACADSYALASGHGAAPLDELAITLNNDMASLPRRFVLVLDEYEVIHGQAVHDIVSGLLRHCPPTLHLVLISRYSPSLPLAGLRAKQQLTEMRTQDLRFTPAETDAYLRCMLPDVAPADLHKLEETSEGWIAGLQISGVLARQTRDGGWEPAPLSGDQSGISAYFADEVLARQPRALQTFLLKTSILDTFCAALCDAVAGEDGSRHGAQEHLDQLLRANIFVSALDDQGQWYRFHPLFRDMLRQRLAAAFTPDESAALHRRAAAWLAQHGLIDEAVQHAMSSGDLEQAAAIMWQTFCAVLNREDRPTLERWLSLLPEDYIRQRPQLLIIRIWALQFAWQTAAQWRVLDQVTALLDSAPAGTWPADDVAIWRAHIAIFRAQGAFFTNNLPAAIQMTQEVLDVLPLVWLHHAAAHGCSMVYLCRPAGRARPLCV